MRGGVRRSRDEAVQPRDRTQSRLLRQRPLNRETLNDRPTLLTSPQRTTDHPNHPIERAGKRDAVTKRHFQSNLSSQMGWYVIAVLCYTVSHNVNTMLLQHAPNLFNLLLIHTSNANATVDITITVLNNFELKRDTVQAKNYLPAQ